MDTMTSLLGHIKRATELCAKKGKDTMNLLLPTAALLLATATAEDFNNDIKASRDLSKHSADVRNGGGLASMDGDEDVVQEFLPKMSFSAKDYFRENKKADADKSKKLIFLLLGC